MTKGYLYVANKQKFIDEAMISARSIKDFSSLPIAIVCTEILATEKVCSFFDEVIINEEINNYVYLSKIIGIQNSPFERTIFLDSDTFVCADISPLFELLEMVDIATTQEKSYHTTDKISAIKFKNIIPEFNSGVIVLKKNNLTDKLLADWFKICVENKIGNDMPGLREAIFENFNDINYFILPEEFNSHGYKSMLMLNGEVKVIHERLGSDWKSTTPFFLSYLKGKKFAKKINKKHYKRLYVPHIGIIPYSWNFNNVLLKFKKMIGVKRVSKNR